MEESQEFDNPYEILNLEAGSSEHTITEKYHHFSK